MVDLHRPNGARDMLSFVTQVADSKTTLMLVNDLRDVRFPWDVEGRGKSW